MVKVLGYIITEFLRVLIGVVVIGFILLGCHAAFGQTLDLSRQGKITVTTVGALPGSGNWTGRVYYVSDGTTQADCSTGSGSANVHACVWTGAAWEASGGVDETADYAWTGSHDFGGGSHDMTTVDASYPNILTDGIGIAHGADGSENTTRRPSILLTRQDDGNWTTGNRAASFNFRVVGGTGNKELFTVESRAAGAGNTGDTIGFTSRMVAEDGLPTNASVFALWSNADCFDADSDCGGAEINIINDTSTDADSSYFGGGTNRKYGMAIIGAPGASTGDPTTPLAIGVQDASNAFQMGIEFSQTALKSGAPAILLPNNHALESRDAANSAYQWLIGSDSNDDTIIDTANSRSILFQKNGATTARIDPDGFFGVNVDPSTWFHVKVDNASVADVFRFEQDGTGDAGMQFLLTATQAWAMGVDNSESDRFSIASTAGLGSNDRLIIATGGTVTIPNIPSCDTIDTDSNGALSCGTDDDVPESGDFTAIDTEAELESELTDVTDVFTNNDGALDDDDLSDDAITALSDVAAKTGGGTTVVFNDTPTLLSPDLGDNGTKPTCDSSVRGVIWFDEGGAGVADTAEICGKNAADAYAWVALATF